MNVTSIPRLGLLLILSLSLPQAVSAQRPRAARARAAFVPGEVWLDTKGKPINAHGGGMLYQGKTYYWYGENKAGRSWVPEVNRNWDGYRVDVTGIRCYSSKDLYRWKDQGLVLKSAPGDPASDLHPSKVVERPKVAFNPKTRKFVMWMHIDTLDYQSARAGVAIADSPMGKFNYLGSVKPEGGDSRDQTLFVDDDGKAYRVYSSEWNKATYISLLSDDWLKHSGQYAKLFPGQGLEAQAVFKRQGKYYLFASECTGWDPNPTHAAVADSIFGPWRELGNPCLGPDAEVSFQAQSTYVFQVAGKKDAFVFMADRWHKSDLPDSRYAWLPVLFGADGPKLKWMSEWDLSFFDRDRSDQQTTYQPSGTPRLRGGIDRELLPAKAGVSTRRPSGEDQAQASAATGFSIQTQDDHAWLVRPDGTRFFSLGVCVVDQGASRETFNPTNPGYAAFQHYSGSNQWAAATLERLKSWNFTTIGGWSDRRSQRGAAG